MGDSTAPAPSNSTTTPSAPAPSNSTTTPSAQPPSNSTVTPPTALPPSNSTTPPPEPPVAPPKPPSAAPPRSSPTPVAPPPSNTTTPSEPPQTPPVTPPPANETTPSAPPPQGPSTPPPPPKTPSPPDSPGDAAPSPSLNPPSPPSPSSPPSPPAPNAPPHHSSPPHTPGGSTSSSPSPRGVPPGSDSGSDSGSLQTPVLVGVIVGGVAVVAILALLFVFCFRKKKRRRDDDDDGYYAPPPPPPPRPKNDNNGGQPYHWHQAASPAADNLYAMPPEPTPPPPNGLRPPPGRMHHHMPPAPPPYYNSSSGGSGSNHSGPENPMCAPQPGIVMGFSKSTYTYEELAMATDGFSEANLLGQGGFGYVHKGVFPSGKEVAIKSLKAGSGQGEREFKAEVEIISRVHHRHLVSLVGYCMAGSQRMLVYEFVPNNTMEFHLHGRGRPVMDWATRIKIAVGSAKGLAYLHEDCQPKIIHRDIKASNILLDFKFEAKVADFGLAKFTSDMNTHVSTRVMGTFGYLAPEYALSGKLTEKSDVFSFGVMLLELITGKRPVSPAHSYMEDSLVDWARPLLTRALEDGNFDSLEDPNLQNQYNHDQMARMVACAAACVRHSARRRPRMSQVVRILEGDASLSDLSDGLTPGHSSAYSLGSSDYDNNQYREDMRKFRKQVLVSEEHGPSSEYSGQTSEYGLNPSVSSSEGQHTREMEMRRLNNDRQGFKESSLQ